MAKATDTRAPAGQVRAVATFCVGVRTIHAGEILPADDEAATLAPEMFGPVEHAEG